MTARSAYLAAWVSLILGISVSVAANILHADLDGSTPAELIGAAFWPIGLLLSIEVLIHTPWPRGRLWAIGRYLIVDAVGLVAAFLSYRHMAGLLKSWGEDGWNAHLGPLAVDGMMLIASLALLAISKHNHPMTVELEVIDHRHVFTWPEPIGPQEQPILRYARQAEQLAGTGADPLAFLGDMPTAKRGGMRYPVVNQLAEAPADDPMLDRILAGIPDGPQITLQDGDHRHVGYDVPIGPEPYRIPKPYPVPKPVKPAPEQKPKPKAKAAKARTSEPDPARVEEAYRYWQSNPEATGDKIAEIAGVGRATGYRYRSDWNAASVGVS